MNIPLEKEEKKRRCRACCELKPLKSFYRNRLLPDGYESRCKTCKKAKILIPTKTPKIERSSRFSSKWENYFRLVTVSKEDFVGMYRFLKGMGYDIDSEKSIHQQFCEKNNLKPKKRAKKHQNRWTLDELRKDFTI